MLFRSSLLFCRATQREVQVITELLQTYADASGQCINFEKSSVYFSTNIATNQRKRIKVEFGIREVDRFESYLGLPTLGRAKYQTFSFIKDRVWKKIHGWRGKCCREQERKFLLKQ